MSNENDVQKIPKALEKKEYKVVIEQIHHGYVKVLARSKDEAEEVVKQMNRKKMLTYFQEEYKFTTIGEASNLNDRH